MTTVLSNELLAPGIYRLSVEGNYGGSAGQFYMLRCWREYPLLSRPISIHDLEFGSIAFLYRVNGIGTRLLSELKPGQQLRLDGPFGNGFPQPEGRTALVGGGMGIAPLLLAAKRMPDTSVFLGFSGDLFATWTYHEVHANVTVVTGGTVLDALDPAQFDTIFACGPVPMLEALAKRTAATGGIRLFVSVEKRMACGIGACNGCHIEGKANGRKACTDGPVFLAEEVNFNELYEL